MTPELRRILWVIRDHGRAEILKEFRLDSCIGSTRVVCKVLDHFGYRAVPFGAKVHVYNPVMTKAMARGIKFPDSGSPELHRMLDLIGGWSVGLGETPVDADPVGHLVALLPKEKLIVDASLDQANRPQKQIELPPVLIAHVDDDFIAGKSPDTLMYNGCKLVYHAEPGNTVYKQSGDWNIPNRTKHAIKAIIKLVEETPRG
jgi:hypothetical protein